VSADETGTLNSPSPRHPLLLAAASGSTSRVTSGPQGGRPGESVAVPISGLVVTTHLTDLT